MVYIEPREGANRTVSYRVRWRAGGRRQGVAEVITCYDREQAELVRRLVDRADQQRPTEEALRSVGIGLPHPSDEGLEPTSVPSAVDVPLFCDGTGGKR